MEEIQNLVMKYRLFKDIVKRAPAEQEIKNIQIKAANLFKGVYELVNYKLFFEIC